MSRKFKSEVRVIYADTDAMGIVYHMNYIKWFEIGRTEFLRQMGCAYSQLEKEGVWMPVTGVTCEYKNPARYDDILEISSWVKELKGASTVIGYEIRRKGDGDLVVSGSTSHAFTTPDLAPLRLKRDRPDVYEIFSQCLDQFI